MMYLKNDLCCQFNLTPKLLFILTVFAFSCSVPKVTPSISPLQEIEENPTGHYWKTSQLSEERNPDHSTLDEIAFPKKANVLVTKIISKEYLTKDEIKESILELSPPANSSEQTRAELDFLLQLQNNRTPEQVEEALRMHDIVYFPIWGMKKTEHLFFEVYEVFGPNFEPENYPKTKKLLHNIMKEMRVTEFTAKNHFLRARPRQLESKLEPLKKMSSSSFASGHTLWAYMQAYLLSELIPEKRTEFLNLAYDIGFSREVLGVHYPSDEESSRKLAHQLLKKMWDKPNFKKDFYEASKEWKTK